MKQFFFITIILYFTLFFACKPGNQLSRNLNVSKNNQKLSFTFLYSEALKSKMHKNYDEALMAFKSCLHLNPKSSATAYQIANLYLQKNSLDSARYFSDIAYSINPNNEWYILQRANLAKLSHYNVTYYKMYEKLVQLKPRNTNYLYEYALINFKKFNNDTVISIANRLEKLVGVNESISFLKNHIYYRKKDYKSVINEFKKLINVFPDSINYVEMLANFYYTSTEYDKALNVYNEYLNEFDNNSLLYLGIARVYVANKKLKKAYPYLIKGLKSKNVTLNKKVEVAEPLLDSKNIFTNDSIELIYEQIIKNSTRNSDITQEYLEYLIIHKKLTKAEKVILVLINKQPENFKTWEFFFNILVNQNRYSELDIHTSKALEYFPNQAIVYFFKGFSLFSLKKYNKSIIFFKTGLDLSFDNKTLKLEFLLYLAEAYHNIQNNKKSDFYFEEYLKFDMSNAYLMNNYAYYLTNRNTNFERANKLSKKSLEIEPFNSSFLDTYAWILFLTKDYKQSLNYIKRSYKYGGNKNPVVIEHYGDVLNKLDMTKEALEKWEEAYNMNKSNLNLKNKIDNNK